MARAEAHDDWPRTVAEFQVWHDRQPERWEFIDGRPRMMAPGSMRHSILKRNVFRLLDGASSLRGCEVLVDGPQILTDEISAIPDVVVTCVPLDLSTPVVPEPVIIVEVMSPSTERDDTERKWWSYRKVPALRHYIVIAQERREILVHSRAGDLWHERFISEGAIRLDDPPVRLDIDEIYAGTGLSA
jgi:Uma2 family endonuclease